MGIYIARPLPPPSDLPVTLSIHAKKELLFSLFFILHLEISSSSPVSDMTKTLVLW